MEPSQRESRRRFLQQAATSIGLVLSAPVIASIVSSCEFDETVQGAGETFTVNINDFPELSVVGGIVSTEVGKLNDGRPVFISRVGASTFAVFSTTCTHQGCPVDLPFAPGENCVCPCHGAAYNPASGAIVKQPTGGTATDLPTFASTFDVDSGQLTITG
jgi:Rieske Fe-S protein